jgi:hypothetical protein
MPRQPDLDPVPWRDLEQLCDLFLRSPHSGRGLCGDRHGELEAMTFQRRI